MAAADRPTQLGVYRILGKLGEGGMGEVLLGEDSHLGRKAALKVLPSEVAADPDRQARFEREARLVASLNHPHIVTLYGYDVADGQPFLAFELVEGETLSRRMREDGLEIVAALDLAIPLADALAYAHAHGIVHRDLKPGNVMVTTDGHLKVLDFGLAKLVDPRGEVRGDETTDYLTHTGMMLGTVPYMSPEQARGEPADARSDIFSFGIILYELVAGRRPFTGENTADLASSILRDEPEPLHVKRPDVPPELERIVGRCLAKTADRRYQHAKDLSIALAELRDALRSGTASASPALASPSQTAEAARTRTRAANRQLLWATIVLVLAVASFLVYRQLFPTSTSAPQASKAESVAVLPFENLSGSDDDRYFSDGMTDELLTALAGVPGLRVPGRSSVFAVRGKDWSPQQIGKALGVEHLVEGTVQREGDQIRITARLIGAGDGFQAWSQTFERKYADLFALQDEIAHAIVGELKVRLGGPPGKALVVPGTDRLDAYNLVMRAKYSTGLRDPQALAEGVRLYQRAIEIDPSYALAQAGLAKTLGHIVQHVGDPDGTRVALALASARRAIELDPQLAEGYSALSSALEFSGAEPPEILGASERAIQLAPDYAPARLGLGSALCFLGYSRRGLSELEIARRLDPLDRGVIGTYAVQAASAGRLESAEKEARSFLDLDPDWVLARGALGILLLSRGVVDGPDVELGLKAGAQWPVPQSVLLIEMVGHESNIRIGPQSLTERVIQLEPNGPWAELAQTYADLAAGRGAALADRLVQEASEERLGPRSAWRRTWSLRELWAHGEPADSKRAALAWSHRPRPEIAARATNFDIWYGFVHSWWQIADAQLILGDRKAAAEIFVRHAKWMKGTGWFSPDRVVAAEGIAGGLADEVGTADRALRELDAMAGSEEALPLAIDAMLVAASTQDADLTLARLRVVLELTKYQIGLLHAEPLLGFLRDDPRYWSLLREMGSLDRR